MRTPKTFVVAFICGLRCLRSTEPATAALGSHFMPSCVLPAEMQHIMRKEKTVALFLSTPRKAIVNRNVQGPPCCTFLKMMDCF